MFIETAHERFGSVKHVATPIRVGEPSSGHRRAPQRNEHADEILRGLLGYDDARVARLTAAGAFTAAALDPA